MSYRKNHLKPKFRKIKPQKIFYKRPIFLFFIFIFVFSSLFYIFLFSRITRVAAVETTGLQKITLAEIENFIEKNTVKNFLSLGVFNLSSKSIFIFNAKKTREIMLKQFPVIEEVKIKKNIIRREIFIEIRERNFFGIFCREILNQEEECFSIDNNGIIFEKAEKNKNVIIRKKIDGDLFEGSQIVSINEINFIKEVKKNLIADFRIEIEEVAISDYLSIKTSEGWEIYFNQNEDVRLQTAKMNTLLKNEIGEIERKKIQYIYLQYKDRAYYK